LDTSGILCHHLVALGINAAKENPEYSDYVIPLALGDTSPSGSLIRLGLIEGSDDGKLKITRLGRLISRLYLQIRTARELLAILPLVQDTPQLLSLLRHLVSVEGGQSLDESFDHLIGIVASTRLSLDEIAEQVELPIGDLMSLLDRSRWLLYAIAAVGREGNMSYIAEQAHKLGEEIDVRILGDEDGSY
jgi:hypothetical protein